MFDELSKTVSQWISAAKEAMDTQKQTHTNKVTYQTVFSFNMYL